ncbi:MAG: NfeD-like protein [Cyanobacteria bacterium P01_F01_bin.153]
MVTIYGICLAIGGVFVALAAIGGIDGAEFETEFDLDVASRDRPGVPRPVYLPWILRLLKVLLSLKFWTFGLCFFGVAGLLLKVLSPGLPVTVEMGVAIAIGALCGGTTVGILGWLKTQEQSNSLLSTDDWIGACGVVEIPFDQDSRGKVKLDVKGAQVRIQARTSEVKQFEVGERVVVIRVEENRAWIVAEDSVRPTPSELPS